MKSASLLMAMSFVGILSMENPPQLPQRGQKRPVSPGKQPAPKLTAVEGESKTAFELLPDEMKVEILKFLITAQGNTPEERLNSATQNIRSFFNINKQFKHLASDSRIMGFLILSLIEKYGIDALTTTIVLNIPSAYEWLLSNWDKVNFIQEDIHRNLDRAIEKRRYNIVEFLLQSSSKENLKPFDWWSALDTIIQSKDYKMLALILTEANPDLFDINGDINFSEHAYQAIKDQDLVTLDLLLKAGAKIDPREIDDEEVSLRYKYAPLPIELAVEMKNPKIIKRLGAAFPKLVDEKIICPKKTPLMLAVENGDLEAVKILIESGADVNYKDRRGQTVLDRVGLKNREAIIKLLKERGAR